MRVVIVHDYLTQAGGAERVVAAMLERWPDAELRTLLYEPEHTFAEFAEREPVTSALQGLSSKLSHRALLPAFPWAMRSLAVEQADLVLSSSSGWAHAISVPDGVPHVCYCHNPARWLYDTASYIPDVRKRLALLPLLRSLRRWDQRGATGPTRYVANSHNVRRRIQRAYGRTADVLHPPVEVDRLTPTPLPASGYVLVLSRLMAYKRIDLAIRAGRLAGMPVVVAGEGPELPHLKALAGNDVHFLGRVPDADLPGLFDGAAAFMLCGEEDFGITPLEANASGRPVVAFGSGGALETVVDGETGVLFGEQTEESAAGALGEALGRSWEPATLAAHAQRFHKTRFLDGLSRIVDETVAEVAGVAPASWAPAEGVPVPA